MKTLKHILPLTFLFLVASCSKEDLSSSVNGHVYTNGTSDPASPEPIEVVLVENFGGSNLSSGERVIQTTMTDQNGAFSFNWEARSEDNPYWVRVPRTSTPPVHYEMPTTKGTTVLAGEDISKNIYLSPHAWIDLEVEVTSDALGADDKLTVDFGTNALGETIKIEFFGPGTIRDVFQTRGNINKSYIQTFYDGNDFFPEEHFVQTIGKDTVYHKITF